ncbi:MAG: hypothetical protein TREMPRED_000032 [Tremellales sp. Tagirdzhanova-0007]|nr:MAG: hypothetical protein TREMPRED_000032 [Tremellales sp. Tagirdzhanova-0007]
MALIPSGIPRDAAINIGPFKPSRPGYGPVLSYLQAAQLESPLRIHPLLNLRTWDPKPYGKYLAWNCIEHPMFAAIWVDYDVNASLLYHMPAMKITAVTLIPLLAVSILAGPIARTTLAPAKRADVQDIVARQLSSLGSIASAATSAIQSAESSASSAASALNVIASSVTSAFGSAAGSSVSSAASQAGSAASSATSKVGSAISSTSIRGPPGTAASPTTPITTTASSTTTIATSSIISTTTSSTSSPTSSASSASASPSKATGAIAVPLPGGLTWTAVAGVVGLVFGAARVFG